MGGRRGALRGMAVVLTLCGGACCATSLVTSGGACRWVLGASRGSCWDGFVFVMLVCWFPGVMLAMGRPGGRFG